MNGSLAFADEVGDHMRFADDAPADAKRVIDEYIERAGLDAPPADTRSMPRRLCWGFHSCALAIFRKPGTDARCYWNR
jgi:hypothetical protein